MAAAASLGTSTKARSLKLAEAKRYYGSHWTSGLGSKRRLESELMSIEIAVPSAHTADKIYVVTYLPLRDDAECVCEAAKHKRPCWHRGMGIAVGRQAAYATKMWGDRDVQLQEGGR